MAVSNINRVILTGNLTKEPDLRETPSGTKVCELRMAVNTPQKKDGEWVSRAHYFQVTAWGRQGENAAKYLDKGSPIAIDGSLEFQSWEAKEGEGKMNSRVVINANQIQFLSKPGEGKQSDDTSKADSDIPF